MVVNKVSLHNIKHRYVDQNDETDALKTSKSLNSNTKISTFDRAYIKKLITLVNKFIAENRSEEIPKKYLLEELELDYVK